MTEDKETGTREIPLVGFVGSDGRVFTSQARPSDDEMSAYEEGIFPAEDNAARPNPAMAAVFIVGFLLLLIGLVAAVRWVL